MKISVVAVIITISVNTVLGLPGSGTTEENPWRIESLADFNEFAADANYWDDWTRLEIDVNLDGQTYSTAVIAPDNNNSNQGFDGPAFTGVFDGNGHKIIALTIDDGGAGNDFLGLFGYIDGGEVRDLGIKGGSVSGEDHIGGLAGESLSSNVSNCYSTCKTSGDWRVGGLVGRSVYSIVSNFSNCYSTGSVKGDGYVGGLVGENVYSTVSNCYSTGSVKGDEYVGGLVGRNFGGTFSNCHSTGDVDGDIYVGGLVGGNRYGNVSNCYSTSGVNGIHGVGGLVGESWSSSVSNCYSTGDVNGDGQVGGLVGRKKYGSVSNCYSTGYVSGTDFDTGGLVGFSFGYGGTVSNCYSIGDVNGTGQYVGGLVGRNYYSSSVSNSFWDIETQTHGVTESIGHNYGTVTNVEGLPTADMQIESTFTSAGWDFNTPIWKMCELPDYPRLWWEKCPIVAAIDIKTEMLNLNSKGRWITSYIWLPEDYNVADIDPNTVKIESEPNDIYAEWVWYNEKQNIVMAKFNRSEVRQILDDEDIIEIGEAELTVSGELENGLLFVGTDVIRVRDKGRKNK